MVTKMIGIPSNLKWKFPINATTIMHNFLALLKWLHRKIWPNWSKTAKKLFFKGNMASQISICPFCVSVTKNGYF